MGIMVDFREITEEELKALRNTVKEQLLNMVSQKSGKSKGELVVRDILPLTDLGLNTEEWDNETQQTAAAWTKDWSHELDEDEGVAFFGVHIHDATCDLLFMRYKLGATGSTVKDLVSIQSITNNLPDKNKGYHVPVYYGGKETVYIDYMGRATVAAAAAHIELLGMFCEPKGEVIS